MFLLPIVEGLTVLMLIQVIGGYYLLQLLYRICPDQPIIFLQIISSSSISSVVASVYMLIRCKFFPKIFLNRKMIEVIIVGIVGCWIIIFIESIFFAKSSFLMRKIFELNAFYLYASLFLINIWTPIFEETLFRGYFLEILLKRYSQISSVIVSGFLFIIPHTFTYVLWGNIYICGILFLYIGGVILSLVYIQGGLIASIATHIFFNSYLTYLYMP